MATGKESAKQPAESKSLEKAVGEAVKEAEHDAKTGNVATVKETTNQPAEDLPTGARSHLNP
jgi:hypothetical protein